MIFRGECVALEVDFSFSGERVARIFDRVALSRSLPTTIKSDNGAEFTSGKLLEWSGKTGIELHFIELASRTKMPSSKASTDVFATSLIGVPGRGV